MWDQMKQMDLTMFCQDYSKEEDVYERCVLGHWKDFIRNIRTRRVTEVHRKSQLGFGKHRDVLDHGKR